MTWTTRPRSKAGKSGERRLAWIAEGSGDPLLLIHGVGLRAEAWGAQLPELARRYAVRALDLPGHGESPPLEDGGAIADFVECVAEALADIGPSFVAGHSIGAMIALELAARPSALCRGVIALNAIHRRSPEAAAAVRARAEALSGEVAADPTATLGRWFGEDLESGEARACREWLTRVDPAAYRTAYRAFAEADGPSDETLCAIACPALFMTGNEDPNSTPAMSEAMAARVPAGEVRILEGAAHMLPMTHPSDVNRALLDFMTRAAGERP